MGIYKPTIVGILLGYIKNIKKKTPRGHFNTDNDDWGVDSGAPYFQTHPFCWQQQTTRRAPMAKLVNTTPTTIEAGHLWVVGIPYLFLAIHSWLVKHYTHIYIVKSSLWLFLWYLWLNLVLWFRLYLLDTVVVQNILSVYLDLLKGIQKK